MSTVEVADIKGFEEGKGTSTPWGRAQYSQQLERGVTWYGTAEHGGLSVSLSWAEGNLTRHAMYLGKFWGGKLWYEKNRACSIVFLEHPKLGQRRDGRPVDNTKAEAVVRRWHSIYFDKEFQEAAAKAGSVPLAEDLEKGDKLVLSCFGGMGNEEVLTLLGVYNNGKSALVEDDCLGRSKLPRPQMYNYLLRVERDGEVIWKRP